MNKVFVVLAGGLVIARLILDLGDSGKVAQVRAEAARLERQRDSLMSVVRERTHRQAALAIERQAQETAANRLRDSVTALEQRRAAEQLTVRQIHTVGALQDRLRAAFPELGDSAWGLTTLPMEDGDTLGLEYLLVPAWFAETFVIDHANAASWREQKDQLIAVDSLRLVVTALQDTVTRLEAANAHAYRTGYQAAYAGYQDLTQRYVAELKKPRIRLASAVGLLGAVGAGLVIGRAIP
jgi:uncharacterized protein YlxW (UPF0749 family)